jgi:hypothetical protein
MITFENTGKVLKLEYPDFKFKTYAIRGRQYKPMRIYQTDDSDIFIDLDQFIDEESEIVTVLNVARYLVECMNLKNNNLRIIMGTVLNKVLRAYTDTDQVVNFDFIVDELYKVSNHILQNKDKYPLVFGEDRSVFFILSHWEDITKEIIENLKQA